MIATHPYARRLLARAIARNRLAHAWLCTGPEGAGKRTLALEFAGALLCAKRSFPPCGECGACRRVSAGNHPDVAMVEAETRNILIAQVRELTEKLQYHSFEGGYKVGVIPEAERMAEPAQNALLKTLEEPPSDTVLILTCTNLSRLRPTILSRCQLLRLGPLPEIAVTQMVKEARELSAEEARLVAALAQGNARRALDLDLELVVDFRKQMVAKLLALDGKDRIAVLDFAEGLSKVEYPLETVFDLLAGFYWDVLYAKLGREDFRNQDLAAEARQEARRTELNRILEELAMIHEVRARLTGSNANPRLCWEILTMSLKADHPLNLLTEVR